LNLQRQRDLQQWQTSDVTGRSSSLALTEEEEQESVEDKREPRVPVLPVAASAKTLTFVHNYLSPGAQVSAVGLVLVRRRLHHCGP
jgi:hypothetical protein